jgi:hypothetical protein
MKDSDLQRLTAFFTVEGGARDGDEVGLSDVLTERPVFLIGSDPRSHLVLEDAAPAHATVTRRDDTYSIQPRFPYLDVFVNGKRVTSPTLLQPESTVRIGATTLRFGAEMRVAALAETAPPRPEAMELPAIVPSELDYAATVEDHVREAPVVYRPATQEGGRSGIGAILGVVTVLGIFAWVAFNALSPVLSPPVPQNELTFAYDDGNVTLVMFDADW